ncbi:hypothetical protein BKA58DRAFT_128427 [Alternaria rosae]|uniref:uncharacterized protein n=1 Tax=Alternaria rosae TaxID=1187941 RepID=UPI001E8D6D86|nr:uncharacterized protein BKA58DRAFT_128427 [Alternaria rosae]KAH6875765.1 hypothetical protein BKA58DRAFT_128427 [Alternaria rosae]
MVLIASSSVFPYGMMGRSVDGEKIERREDVADVLVFRFCSYSGVASRHACLTHNARVDVLVGSLKARLHQPVAALSATTCHIPPASTPRIRTCCLFLVSLRRVLTWFAVSRLAGQWRAAAAASDCPLLTSCPGQPLLPLHPPCAENDRTGGPQCPDSAGKASVKLLLQLVAPCRKLTMRQNSSGRLSRHPGSAPRPKQNSVDEAQS